MVNPSLAIGVIGAGSWGTALSLLLAGKGHRVDLWVYEKDLCDVMNRERENRVYLPGFQLPEAIHPSHSLQEVVANKKIILVVVPTHVLAVYPEYCEDIYRPRLFDHQRQQGNRERITPPDS